MQILNSNFFKRSLHEILPAVFVCVVVACLIPNTYDFQFHVQKDNPLYSSYPPMSDALINFTATFTYTRFEALLILNLVLVIILPYILIYHITRHHENAWLYLYGCGLPFVMFFAWIPAQALVHILVLFAISTNFIGLMLFGIVGHVTHREWALAFVLTACFIASKKYFKWI